MRRDHPLKTLEISLRALAALIVVVGLAACGEARPKRLPQSGFRVKFDSHKVPREMKVNEIAAAEITVTKRQSGHLAQHNPTKGAATSCILPTTG